MKAMSLPSWCLKRIFKKYFFQVVVSPGSDRGDDLGAAPGDVSLIEEADIVADSE